MPKKKKKVATKAVLPKKKAEPETIEVSDESTVIPATKLELVPEPMPTYDLGIPTPTPAQDVLLAILKQAPLLPWEIDKAYIGIDFRKQYVALLRNLVKMLALPYNVNQAGKLTKIER